MKNNQEKKQQCHLCEPEKWTKFSARRGETLPLCDAHYQTIVESKKLTSAAHTPFYISPKDEKGKQAMECEKCHRTSVVNPLIDNCSFCSPSVEENWENRLKKLLDFSEEDEEKKVIDFISSLLSHVRSETREEAIDRIKTIKRDFIARTSHEDYEDTDSSLVEETIYHIDTVIHNLKNK